MSDESPPITVNVKGPSELKLSVSISLDSTVLQLKEAIEAQRSDVSAASQRLIYSGKVLKDEEQLSTYKLQNNHTIHMVRSASRSAPSTGNPSSSASPASPPTSAATSARAASAAAGVPAMFGAGQQFANNPLAPLARADYAGPQLSNAQNAMFQGTGLNPNDPNMLMNMMSDPDVRGQMRSMLSRPEVIDQIIASNPQLAAMPGIRDMMRSPAFIDMLTDPAAMQRAAQLQSMMGGAGGMGGMGGMFGGGAGAGAAPPQWPPAGAFGTPSTAAGAPAGAQAGQAGIPPNPFAGAGAGAGAPGGGMMDANFLRSLFGDAAPGGAPGGAPGAGASGAPPNPFAALAGLGGLGAGGARAQPTDSRPPEERYADQLAQMQAMGLTDGPKNLRALLMSGGSVEGAMSIIFDGGAQ